MTNVRFQNILVDKEVLGDEEVLDVKDLEPAEADSETEYVATTSSTPVYFPPKRDHGLSISAGNLVLVLSLLGNLVQLVKLLQKTEVVPRPVLPRLAPVMRVTEYDKVGKTADKYDLTLRRDLLEGKGQRTNEVELPAFDIFITSDQSKRLLGLTSNTDLVKLPESLCKKIIALKERLAVPADGFTISLTAGSGGAQSAHFSLTSPSSSSSSRPSQLAEAAKQTRAAQKAKKRNSDSRAAQIRHAKAAADAIRMAKELELARSEPENVDLNDPDRPEPGKAPEVD